MSKIPLVIQWADKRNDIMIIEWPKWKILQERSDEKTKRILYIQRKCRKCFKCQYNFLFLLLACKSAIISNAQH